MNYCDTCIHKEVCGLEDNNDASMTYCSDRVEYCKDCISREAALDNSGLGEFHRYDDYLKMRNYLKSLPSVTPRPKIENAPLSMIKSIREKEE